jgi:thiol-disulfide isomerase/thioredoxin
VSENSSGRATIIAAVLVSFSIIGGSFFIADSLDRTTDQLELATEALGDLELAAAAPGARPPSRPNRPDANKEYDVEVGDAPTKGGENAKVTIIEFSDFQCPFCNRVSPTLAQIEKEYGDQVQIAFKHMPLSFHAQAPQAHAASEAAHRQGKFWEMHDKIFSNQRDLSIATLGSLCEGYRGRKHQEEDRCQFERGERSWRERNSCLLHQREISIRRAAL